MKKKNWDVLGSRQLTNIISCLTPLSMVAGIVIKKVLQYFGSPPDQAGGTQNNFLMYVLIFLLLATIVNIVFSYGIWRKYNIIKILCKLQNKYILEPDFKMAKEHGERSLEKNLKLRGEAWILTNSLKYDIYFCDTIASNIIKGAKYIYVLPTAQQAINDLKSYIVALYNALGKEFENTGDAHTANEVGKKTIDALSKKLEFWFFKEDVLCLYNFAKFNQLSESSEEQPFVQSWWYVNPIDDKENSYMLSRGINDKDDQDQLDKVFSELKSISQKDNGCKIYNQYSGLNEDFRS